MSEGPSPHERLEAAAHIKDIVEAPGDFDPRHADAVAHLLAELPATIASVTWNRTDNDGERTEGGLGRHELRCGAWVVERISGPTAVIKTADWVLDLGPEGGDKGGEIVAEGTPEQVAEEPRSYTGGYLKALLKGPRAEPPPAEEKESPRGHSVDARARSRRMRFRARIRLKPQHAAISSLCLQRRPEPWHGSPLGTSGVTLKTTQIRTCRMPRNQATGTILNRQL